MPLVAFHCSACGKAFELFLRPSEALRGAQCPGCGGYTPAQADESPAASPGPACDLFKKS